MRVTVDDVDGHSPGSDNDPPKTVEITMQVIRLDEVQLYYYYPDTGYPYVGDAQIDTRAVVTATCTAQHEYCDLPFDSSLHYWWKAGSEGPGSDDDPPPTTQGYPYQPYDWPSNWPALDIDWVLLWHLGSPPCDDNHNRTYSYGTPVSYLSNSWGEDNRAHNTQGLHRLRATATMHPGTAWAQTKTSPDKEYARRICPKAYCDWIENARRQDYVEWCSTYVNEPYEWGGEGFGGEDSGQDCAGGADTYDGYGIDCSGLVSCGACRARYNWNWWRQNTCGLAGDYCSDPVSYANFDDGDIIVKCHYHVVSGVKRQPSPYEDSVRIIHASAASGGVQAHKVLEEVMTITWWTNKGYSLRRLEAH